VPEPVRAGIPGVHERGAFVHESKKRQTMNKKVLFRFAPDVLEARTVQTEKKLTMYRVKSLRYLSEILPGMMPDIKLHYESKSAAYWAIKEAIQINYYSGLPENENQKP